MPQPRYGVENEEKGGLATIYPAGQIMSYTILVTPSGGGGGGALWQVMSPGSVPPVIWVCTKDEKSREFLMSTDSAGRQRGCPSWIEADTLFVYRKLTLNEIFQLSLA